MTQLRCALAQIDTCVGDLVANAQKIIDCAHRASNGGARLVIFPEMTLTGYPIEDLALRASFRQKAWDHANELAARLADEGLSNLFVFIGTIGTDHISNKPTNRLVVLHQGMVWAAYDKMKLPNYGVFDEYRIFAAGQKSLALELDGARVGVAICEDLWQEDGPVNQLQQEHLDLLVTINGSPYEEGKTDRRVQIVSRAAKQLNTPVIYVNQVGAQDDLVFDGGSFVLDVDGTLLARSPMFVEHLSFITIDTSQHCQTVGTIAQPLDVNEEIYTACVLGLKDYMFKNGFTGVCLGLSGGIDSALVAAMAADACAGQNVHGITMPSMYSSQGSITDAQELADNLGANLYAEPIGELVDAFEHQLALDGVAAENLQARIRGVIVMAYSNQRGLLALATGNKSELACGYSTIYGDAVGGYAPIKDVFKTRVWQLARWRNQAFQEGVGIGQLHIVGNEGLSDADAPDIGINRKTDTSVMIPVNSIDKAPSAELRPGQKDSDSLPQYELLDQVLQAYIELAHGRQELLDDGFDADVIDLVVRLVDRAEWKRRQYPLGPKVSALAFGRDRRLPVTSACS